jgi:hypothetical protein
LNYTYYVIIACVTVVILFLKNPLIPDFVSGKIEYGRNMSGQTKYDDNRNLFISCFIDKGFRKKAFGYYQLFLFSPLSDVQGEVV